MKRVMFGLACAVLGFVLGPLLVAVVGAAIEARNPSELAAGDAVQALVREVQRNDSVAAAITTVSYEGRTECGYDLGTLFDPDASSFEFEAGYHWLSNIMRDGANAERRRLWFADNQSRFDVEFWTRCMRQTVFAPICRERAASALATADAGPLPPDHEALSNITCSYLDGVASLKRIPVVKRPTSPAAE